MSEAKKKSILFLIESLSGGGAEKVLSVLLRHFDHERHEVTVCPIVDTGVYCDEVRAQVAHYRPVITYRGGVVSRMLNRLKYKMVYSWLPLKWVYRLFIPKGNDVEIAFCEGFTTKLLSQSVSQSKKIAWVHIDLTANPWPQRLGIYKDVDEERQTYARYDKIVCVSHTVEESFKEKYGCADKTCTIYNPIDIEDIKEKGGRRLVDNNGVTRIISVGRLVNQKGYDRLLKVVHRLHDEGHNISLTILGEGKDSPQLEGYMTAHGMSKYVRLPGFKDNPYKEMRNADLFVCSSRSEGFSLVIAEAMVLGLPVISTYCSGPNELLGEGRYGILTENSEDGLYKGLRDYLTGAVPFPKNDARTLLARFAPNNVWNQVYTIIE